MSALSTVLSAAGTAAALLMTSATATSSSSSVTTGAAALTTTTTPSDSVEIGSGVAAAATGLAVGGRVSSPTTTTTTTQGGKFTPSTPPQPVESKMAATASFGLKKSVQTIPSGGERKRSSSSLESKGSKESKVSSSSLERQGSSSPESIADELTRMEAEIREQMTAPAQKFMATKCGDDGGDDDDGDDAAAVALEIPRVRSRWGLENAAKALERSSVLLERFNSILHNNSTGTNLEGVGQAALEAALQETLRFAKEDVFSLPKYSRVKKLVEEKMVSSSSPSSSRPGVLIDETEFHLRAIDYQRGVVKGTTATFVSPSDRERAAAWDLKQSRDEFVRAVLEILKEKKDSVLPSANGVIECLVAAERDCRRWSSSSSGGESPPRLPVGMPWQIFTEGYHHRNSLPSVVDEVPNMVASLFESVGGSGRPVVKAKVFLANSTNLSRIAQHFEDQFRLFEKTAPPERMSSSGGQPSAANRKAAGLYYALTKALHRYVHIAESLMANEYCVASVRKAAVAAVKAAGVTPV